MSVPDFTSKPKHTSHPRTTDLHVARVDHNVSPRPASAVAVALPGHPLPLTARTSALLIGLLMITMALIAWPISTGRYTELMTAAVFLIVLNIDRTIRATDDDRPLTFS